MAELVVILHDIRSAHNVGSIFRTADAAGVEHIYLTGYTPAPHDRFGRVRKEIAKTALGAEQVVTWERADLEQACASLRSRAFTVAAVEQDERATLLSAYQPAQKVALIFGHEVTGVPRHVLDASDDVIEIPMYGTKESLNVSVAVGVALFTLRFNT